jgi:signal transduction histidine kinase
VTHAEGTGLADGEARVLVDITDRGCGFDLDAVQASRDSIGLTSLTERVTLAGGTVEIFSRRAQGTRVHAEFPLGLEPLPGVALSLPGVHS